MEGLAKSDISKDAPPHVSSDFVVAIAGLGESFRCKSGQSILVAMIAAGRRPIAVGCRSGGCGVCRIKVIKGACTTGRMNRAVVSEADEAAGILLACQALPTSDITIELSPLHRYAATPPKDLAA
jgi:ferredoxin